MTDSASRARLPTVAQDVAVTLVLLVAGVGGTRPAGQDQLEWSQRPDGLAYLLVILAAAPFVLRRRKPVGAFVASGAAVVTYLLLDYPYGPILFTVPVGAYTLGRLLPRRAALRWVGGYYVLVLAAIVSRMVRHYDVDLWRQIAVWALVSLAAFAAPLAIGAAARVRRESEAGVRAAQARRAVADERLRMAQELHDSIGHGLAVIAMQAGVALHVLDREPGKARESLEAIRDTSRRSLDGLRSQLQVMREPDRQEDAAPRPLRTGLAELEVLIDRIRAGGLDVRADLGPGLCSVPAEADVAAYRIVQEALTNVLRHAGASRADVSVQTVGGAVLVEVVDDGTAGPGHPAQGAGSGIAGMHARAEALGGTVTAGPSPRGGFAVRARLPFADGRVSDASGAGP